MKVFALPCDLGGKRGDSMKHPHLHGPYLLRNVFCSLCERQNQCATLQAPPSLEKRLQIFLSTRNLQRHLCDFKSVCDFLFSATNHVARFFVSVIIQYSILFVIIQTGISVQKCKLFSILCSYFDLIFAHIA